MANIFPFRAALPSLKNITSFDDFFKAAKQKFSLYIRDGIYECRTQAAFYIYRIKRPHRSHTGVVACTQILDYINGNIKKHEHTIKTKEERMLKLFKERQALIKPILLTYPNALEIDAFINRWTVARRPAFSIPFQDEEHIFWEISEPLAVEHVKAIFSQHVAQAYICDGHHRIKTAENLYREYQKASTDSLNSKQDYNRTLVAYFPISEIEVHNYNRALLSFKGVTEEEFLEKLRAIFEIKAVTYPVQPLSKHHMGLYLGASWYDLTLRAAFLPKHLNSTLTESLDVHILNHYVFANILGIEDIRAEADIKYIEGPKGTFSLEKHVREHRALATFNLYPVALEELIKISNQAGTMPPKSTWIEPRMRNGFIVQMHAERLLRKAES